MDLTNLPIFLRIYRYFRRLCAAQHPLSVVQSTSLIEQKSHCQSVSEPHDTLKKAQPHLLPSGIGTPSTALSEGKGRDHNSVQPLKWPPKFLNFDGVDVCRHVHRDWIHIRINQACNFTTTTHTPTVVEAQFRYGNPKKRSILVVSWDSTGRENAK
jgi:hypothetical protein